VREPQASVLQYRIHAYQLSQQKEDNRQWAKSPAQRVPGKKKREPDPTERDHGDYSCGARPVGVTYATQQREVALDRYQWIGIVHGGKTRGSGRST